jgi:hypothetical protein
LRSRLRCRKSYDGDRTVMDLASLPAFVSTPGSPGARGDTGRDCPRFG